ncbi:glutamate--cysteine ligase [Undibacterium arcticum]|uniref:Glutamate--cysteine ligase n=1 Tax=Undibacterium arcticum TaxID=1762892 RepID=A0ABV7F6J6_9BURK
MSHLLTRRLALFGSPEHRALLGQGLRGIERETLRVTAAVDRAGHGYGALARSPHPHALGAALTHPQITTDYAEALLEFITPAEPDIATALTELEAVHRFVYREMPDEMLWSQSMPCELPSEHEIEIGWYGRSHIGMLKHVYRRGLALRYGKTMQCIAGIHYNFSLSEDWWRALQAAEQAPGQTPVSATDFQSESYIALIRNFRRYSWLLMYLFGASPALSTNFLRGRPHQLDTLSGDTLYLPYATSLRMSDLGYTSKAQAGLAPAYNNLDSYLRSLKRAVSQPYPPYVELGTHRDGEWIQLNTNILQIENEYYSSIRPKRVIRSGERPIQALAARGVQYVEVRCMDIDPFEPMGINLETSRFLDAFLHFCALEESPLTEGDEACENTGNFARTVKDGRRPGLLLQRDGGTIELRSWGLELLERIGAAAAVLDAQRDDQAHAKALAAQRAKLIDPALTPSARVLSALREHGNSFAQFGLHQSKVHAAHFRAHPPTADEAAHFNRLAQASLDEQQAIEQNQSGTFEEFVAAYQCSQLCAERA